MTYGHDEQGHLPSETPYAWFYLVWPWRISTVLALVDAMMGKQYLDNEAEIARLKALLAQKDQ